MNSKMTDTFVTFLHIAVVLRLQLNILKPKMYFMYQQCNIQQFYILSTQCINVFYVDLRTSSAYFPLQH
jgi:hypothetical protein